MKMRRLALWLLICGMVLSLIEVPIRAYAAPELQLQESCTYGEKTDISEYKLTEQQLEEVYYGMLYAGKLPWYTSDEYTYYYSDTSGLVLEFEPVLLDESYDRMAYEQAVAAILHDCILEGMEPWQKALAIHDYLILNCVYDEDLELRTGYDLLIKGSTVCSGYAALYQDLMLRLGIPCLQVDSEEMEHVWNLVQLDGVWYHVDVTWDDPTPDTYGMVEHSYFLRSDQEMKAGDEPHHGWETDILCPESYPNAFWEDVHSQVLFTDDNTCFYLREKDCRNSLYCRDLAQNKESRIYREKNQGVNLGKGKYVYFHTGLSLRDGRLWLSTMDQVLSMKLDGTGQKTEYKYDTKKEKRCLMGCFVTDTEILLSVGNHQGEMVTLTQPLPATGAHQHTFTRTVQAATCMDSGYTTAQCDCGITATGDPKKALGHNWSNTSYRPATLFEDGYATKTCNTCGETESLEYPRIDLMKWLQEHKSTILAVGLAGVCLVLRVLRRKRN